MSKHNGVMMQYFHWYNRADGTLWTEAASKAQELAAAGITSLWLPPAYKAHGGAHDVGYAVYDMYDLGEFDQKGSVRTKYGTRAEYVAAIKTLQAEGIKVYGDTVLNHRMGGETAEKVRATPFAQDDRHRATGPTRDIEAYTRFAFPARNQKYSSFAWGVRHFDAVDYDALQPQEKNAIYLFEGKRFDQETALEKGNFSYLMGCDLDFDSEEVRNEVIAWGKWYLDVTGVDGFRLDAVKHIAAWFFPAWLDAMEAHAGRSLFCVGEYWAGETASLVWYIDRLGGRSSAFDVPMHYRFHAASNDAGYDMRKLLKDTVTEQRPDSVVTFVDNHDSQPLQALESSVAPWFKPLAYATILLRRDGYPCIFYPDYYGAEYDDVGRDGQRHHIVMPSHRWLIDKFLAVRKRCAFGPQLDYADHYNIVGWTRLGDAEHPEAMAVLMSDHAEGAKWMAVGKAHTRFVDVTEHVSAPVTTNEHGWGEFRCHAGSVSVWVQG